MPKKKECKHNYVFDTEETYWVNSFDRVITLFYHCTKCGEVKTKTEEIY